MNGNLIRGGEITGTTLRTANDSNYVSISKQFIRLMESYITRIFMGYYINNNNVMQPTIVLGGNNDITATQGAVLVYQLDGSPKSGESEYRMGIKMVIQQGSISQHLLRLIKWPCGTKFGSKLRTRVKRILCFFEVSK